jgi:hypothetical protein
MFVTIVTGLPRSGTSVMMQMLSAGGLAPLTDGLRQPDEDNPRGYFEFEPVKQIKRDTAWLQLAVGKAVKMVHLLLPELPLDRNYRYRVIMMRRDLSEVLASQKKMLQRQGRAGAELDADKLRAVFEQQLARVDQFLASHSDHFAVLNVSYNDLIAAPQEIAKKVNDFLGGQLDELKMAQAVDPNLYRNRAER